MRLIYNPKRGWFWAFTMRTGSVDFRTCVRIPTIVRGTVLPEWMTYRVGPYPTAATAAENKLF